jgi:hypothetical protein
MAGADPLLLLTGTARHNIAKSSENKVLMPLASDGLKYKSYIIIISVGHNVCYIFSKVRLNIPS